MTWLFLASLAVVVLFGLVAYPHREYRGWHSLKEREAYLTEMDRSLSEARSRL